NHQFHLMNEHPVQDLEPLFYTRLYEKGSRLLTQDRLLFFLTIERYLFCLIPLLKHPLYPWKKTDPICNQSCFLINYISILNTSVNHKLSIAFDKIGVWSTISVARKELLIFT